MLRSRWKRLLLLSLGLLVCLGVVSSVLFSLGESISFFYSPSDITRISSSAREIRLGGTVRNIEKSSRFTRFVLSDGFAEVSVVYEGLSPALMRDGIDVIVAGRLEDQLVYAKQILIKHDERYYPPENLKLSVQEEN